MHAVPERKRPKVTGEAYSFYENFSKANVDASKCVAIGDGETAVVHRGSRARILAGNEVGNFYVEQELTIHGPTIYMEETADIPSGASRFKRSFLMMVAAPSFILSSVVVALSFGDREGLIQIGLMSLVMMFLAAMLHLAGLSSFKVRKIDSELLEPSLSNMMFAKVQVADLYPNG